MISLSAGLLLVFCSLSSSIWRSWSGHWGTSWARGRSLRRAAWRRGGRWRWGSSLELWWGNNTLWAGPRWRITAVSTARSWRCRSSDHHNSAFILLSFYTGPMSRIWQESVSTSHWIMCIQNPNLHQYQSVSQLSFSAGLHYKTDIAGHVNEWKVEILPLFWK